MKTKESYKQSIALNRSSQFKRNQSNKPNELNSPGQLNELKICTICVLPETFPGINFSKEGVCNYCQSSHNRKANPADLKQRYRDKFLSLLTQLNEPNELNKLKHMFSG